MDRVRISMANSPVIESVAPRIVPTPRGQNGGRVTVPKHARNPDLAIYATGRGRKMLRNHVGDIVTINYRKRTAQLFAVSRTVWRENGKTGANVMLSVNRKVQRTEPRPLHKKPNVAAKTVSHITSTRPVLVAAVPSTAFLENGVSGQTVRGNAKKLTITNTGIYRSQNVEV